MGGTLKHDAAVVFTCARHTALRHRPRHVDFLPVWRRLGLSIVAPAREGSPPSGGGTYLCARDHVSRALPSSWRRPRWARRCSHPSQYLSRGVVEMLPPTLLAAPAERAPVPAAA